MLASIPEIWLESDRVRVRRERMRQAVATVGVVIFCLVGGAANYLWVNGFPRFLAFDSAAAQEREARAADAAADG